MAKKKKQKAKAVDTPGTAVFTAEQVVEQFRAIAAALPLYDVQVPENRRSQLARVDDRFVAAVANAIGNLPEVQQMLGSSDDDLRDNAADSLRWTAAIDAGRALVAALEAANLQRRQRTGLKALQAYKICQQLIRDGGHAARLGTHVAEMKRLNKLGRGRKSSPTTTPAPAPDQTPQQST